MHYIHTCIHTYIQGPVSCRSQDALLFAVHVHSVYIPNVHTFHLSCHHVPIYFTGVNTDVHIICYRYTHIYAYIQYTHTHIGQFPVVARTLNLMSPYTSFATLYLYILYSWGC